MLPLFLRFPVYSGNLGSIPIPAVHTVLLSTERNVRFTVQRLHNVDAVELRILRTNSCGFFNSCSTSLDYFWKGYESWTSTSEEALYETYLMLHLELSPAIHVLRKPVLPTPPPSPLSHIPMSWDPSHCMKPTNRTRVRVECPSTDSMKFAVKHEFLSQRICEVKCNSSIPKNYSDALGTPG